MWEFLFVVFLPSLQTLNQTFCKGHEKFWALERAGARHFQFQSRFRVLRRLLISAVVIQAECLSQYRDCELKVLEVSPRNRLQYRLAALDLVKALMFFVSYISHCQLLDIFHSHALAKVSCALTFFFMLLVNYLRPKKLLGAPSIFAWCTENLSQCTKNLSRCTENCNPTDNLFFDLKFLKWN